MYSELSRRQQKRRLKKAEQGALDINNGNGAGNLNNMQNNVPNDVIMQLPDNQDNDVEMDDSVNENIDENHEADHHDERPVVQHPLIDAENEGQFVLPWLRLGDNNQWEDIRNGLLQGNENIVLVGEPVALEQVQLDNNDLDMPDDNNIAENISLDNVNLNENVERMSDNDEEHEQDDEEEHFFDAADNFEAEDPKYQNAPLTFLESMLLIYMLMLRHNLTMTCVEDIIHVIDLHCLNIDLKKNSLYRFQQFFNLKGDSSNFQKHYYCSKCFKEIPTNNADQEICTNCQGTEKGYFIHLPFLVHLKEMYRRMNFWEKLQHRFQRPVDDRNDSISDVYDGSLYKHWFNIGFLSDKNNISFTWYTDGIPVFKSSKTSMWPIYFTINELPYEDRIKKENTLLLGLWFGSSKPKINTFFYKLKEKLDLPFLEGIFVKLNDGIRKKIRGILLIGTADLPAKIDCLNFTQFNGAYGCPECFHEGESVTIGPHSSVYCYRYLPEIEERTTARCLEYADTARANGKPHYGVKGHSILSRLIPDCVKGMAIDRMHCSDDGVMKKILTLCFDHLYAGYPFSLVRHTEIINERLTKIKPPKFVHRMPRKVQDLIHWKASELKLFLFYYSIPVFFGVMDDDRLEHFAKLVIATKILSSDEILDLHIDISEILLHCFVKDFERLHQLQFCSINIHLLLHLPNCVRNLGPLWAYSCYPYEDMNGKFLNNIHGTRHIDSQVASSHCYLIKSVKFVEDLPDGPVKNFCKKRKRQVKIIEQIAPDVYSVGCYKIERNIPVTVITALWDLDFDLNNYQIWQYFRLLKNNKLYVAEMYGRTLQTESSVVQYRVDENVYYGVVICWVRLRDNRCRHNANCGCEFQHFTIIRKINTCGVFRVEGNGIEYSTRGYIHRCQQLDDVIAIPVHSIVTPCIYMVIDDEHTYVAAPINTKEFE